MEQRVELHMNAGDGAMSYATNSNFQKFVILKTWSTLDQTLKHMFAEHGCEKRFTIVDLGCASGQNTLLVISHIMETINNLCKNLKVDNIPEYDVYLNDLPNNDFNSLFRGLPNFKQERKNCFVYGVPGSFYGRLLPQRSFHLAYSCYSLHWLSQIPEWVEKYNEKNICIASASPARVCRAYKNQFHMDFSTFLRCRGEEIMPGGHMVLALLGTRDANCSSEEYKFLTLLASTLSDMVDEGLVDPEDLRSFNVPMYAPTEEEVAAIIKQEGSFNLATMDGFEVACDHVEYHESGDVQVVDVYKTGKQIANHVRAFMEPMLTHHFSSALDINDAFDRYARKAAKYISKERPLIYNIVVSLARNE